MTRWRSSSGVVPGSLVGRLASQARREPDRRVYTFLGDGEVESAFPRRSAGKPGDRHRSPCGPGDTTTLNQSAAPPWSLGASSFAAV